jgi:hypothetical protein
MIGAAVKAAGFETCGPIIAVGLVDPRTADDITAARVALLNHCRQVMLRSINHIDPAKCMTEEWQMAIEAITAINKLERSLAL